VAYGQMSPPDVSITGASLTRDGLTFINADYVFEDPDTGFYSAQFPDLVSSDDKYTLLIVGSNGGTDSRRNLTFKSTYC
jgi:hypothetical protein